MPMPRLSRSGESFRGAAKPRTRNPDACFESMSGFRVRSLRERPGMTRGLGREPEVHDVAVGNHVILAFEPQLAGVASTGLAAALQIIVIGDRLRADEATL